MHGFTDPLTITELGLNWQMWRLEHPFVYDRPNGASIVVPMGFETDGASVPEILWDLLPAWGTYSRAAVVHDYLCWLIFIKTPHPQAPNRQAADAIFFEAMGVCGTNTFIKYVLWIGVRIGAYTGVGSSLVNIDNPAPVVAVVTTEVATVVTTETAKQTITDVSATKKVEIVKEY